MSGAPSARNYNPRDVIQDARELLGSPVWGGGLASLWAWDFTRLVKGVWR